MATKTRDAFFSVYDHTSVDFRNCLGRAVIHANSTVATSLEINLRFGYDMVFHEAPDRIPIRQVPGH